MNARCLVPAAVLAVSALLAGCTSAATQAATATWSPVTAPLAGLKQVHDPGQVTGTITGHCQARDGGQLPDLRCTPGSIDPAVGQAHIDMTICVTGYTAKVRPPEAQTRAFKFRAAYPAYGIPVKTASELDHLVPLELGGSNDATNLWPEAGKVPNKKDLVEGALRSAVCSGKVTLTAAQDAIATDWLTAEKALGLGS